MSGVERQRRYSKRIKDQALKDARREVIEAAWVWPPPDCFTIRLPHLKMDPVRCADWIAPRLGPKATAALRDALDQALRKLAV